MKKLPTSILFGLPSPINGLRKKLSQVARRSIPLIFLLTNSPIQANERVAAQAEHFTVRLEGATQGSGVLVERQGNIYSVLTSWHVVQDYRQSDELDIYTSDGSRHDADISSIERVGNVDMAIVRFKSSNKYALPVLSSGKSISSGTKTYVAGFPLPSTAVPVRILRFTSGSMIANARVKIPSGYQLLYSNITFPGMSGGSVLDSNGQLIGIHGQGEIDSMATQREGIAIKTGTNQAVPIIFYMLHKSGEKNDPYKDELEGYLSFEDLIVEAKQLLSSLERDWKKSAEGDHNDHIQFLKKSQDKIDLIILKSEEASRRKESPEAFLIAGTGYFYKDAVFTKLNYTPEVLGDRERFNKTHNEQQKLRIKILRNLDAAIYLDPDNVDALKYRGSVKEKNEEGTGIGDFNKILEIDRNNVEGLSRRASAYFALGIGGGFEDKSNAQKKSYLQLAIEDSTNLLRLDKNDHQTRWNRALAQHKLYELVKYDPAYNSRELLKRTCQDLATSYRGSKGSVDIFPNQPFIKRLFDDCESLSRGGEPKRDYNPSNPSTVPISFTLDPRYQFIQPSSICLTSWSMNTCSFHRQYLDGLAYMHLGRCMVESGESSSSGFNEFFEYSLANEKFFSKEVVELILSRGGVESKNATKMFDVLGCRQFE